MEVRVPDEWREAVNNGDGNTIAALADWFEEAGLTDAAECCRWAFEKKRWPRQWENTPIVAWLPDGCSLLPPRLAHNLSFINWQTFGPAEAFDRLFRGWIRQSPERKAVLWKWVPPS